MHNLKKIKDLVTKGETLQALVITEKLISSTETPSPELRSIYGYCIAKERGQHKKSLKLCKEAIELEPANPEHYYFLGKVYLLNNDKRNAIQTFHTGLEKGFHPGIMAELKKLGIRKPPVIRFLRRSHPINKYLGLFLSRINLR